MARSDRAMQFAPFQALDGYHEEIRKRERIEVPKAELSEEMLEFLDYKIKEMNVGEIVTVVYYSDGAYIKKTGMLSKIDVTRGFLTIVTTDISFEDIYEVIN